MQHQLLSLVCSHKASTSVVRVEWRGHAGGDFVASLFHLCQRRKHRKGTFQIIVRGTNPPFVLRSPVTFSTSSIKYGMAKNDPRHFCLHNMRYSNTRRHAHRTLTDHGPVRLPSSSVRLTWRKPRCVELRTKD